MRKINLKLKQRLSTSFNKRFFLVCSISKSFPETQSAADAKSHLTKMRRAQTTILDESPTKKSGSLLLPSGHILPPIIEGDGRNYFLPEKEV